MLGDGLRLKGQFINIKVCYVRGVGGVRCPGSFAEVTSGFAEIGVIKLIRAVHASLLGTESLIT